MSFLSFPKTQTGFCLSHLDLSLAIGTRPSNSIANWFRPYEESKSVAGVRTATRNEERARGFQSCRARSLFIIWLLGEKP
jgi:hypothetical protein